jgi:putative transposase
MKRSKYSEEQVAYALREAEGGTLVATCADSSASARPRSTSGGGSLATVSERAPAAPPALVADLTLDKHTLEEIIRKKR